MIFWYIRPDAPVSLFFRLFTSVHLLIDVSVEGQYITLVRFVCVLMEEYAANHHNQVVMTTRISLDIFFQPSLSYIAPVKTSWLHPVSAQSWSMLVLAGRQKLACPCAGIHWKILLISWSSLLQRCLACFVQLTWMVCEIEGNWPYSRCFLGVASRICSWQHATFFSSYYLAFSLFVSLASRRCIHVVVQTKLQPGRNPVLFLSEWSTNFRGFESRVDMAPFCLKHVLCLHSSRS